jgi:hypothetical protein
MVDLINCDYDLTALPLAIDMTVTILLCYIIIVFGTIYVTPWFLLGTFPGIILVLWKLWVWSAIIEEW